ncbi:MAG: hypothetical protein EOP48_17405 [Sphingobacteriales bacterium]|nr:MAG: hypothetical protein EOP48_17405 [Sphingobacteriales bacterium]
MNHLKSFLKILKFTALIFPATVLNSCDDQKHQGEIVANNSSNSASESANNSNAETDKWLGQWNGPEGTFLKISGGNGQYEIIIQNLDGSQTYSGKNLDNKIQFERNGIQEIIRATNGVDTGMKWLSDKTNCLTIKTGEGFCK